jgi:hypothetical protein
MAARPPKRTFERLLFYRLKEGIMKLLSTTAVLAACLFGPASALAVPADVQHQNDPRAAVHSSSLGAGPAVSDLRSPDAQQPVETAVTDLRSPDAQQPVTPVHQSPSPVSASPSSSGFDWTDAALGAGSVLAFALLALGAFVVTGASRRHGSTV